MSVTGPDAKTTLDNRHSAVQKVFFACFTERGGASMEDIEAVIPAHRQWIVDQEAAGVIFVAGPFLNEDLSYSGSGMIVLRASTAAEAHAVATQDPMHANGLRTFRIVPWQLNEASVRIALNVSTGSFDLT